MNDDSSYPAFSCISSVVCPRRCLPPKLVGVWRCSYVRTSFNLVRPSLDRQHPKKLVRTISTSFVCCAALCSSRCASQYLLQKLPDLFDLNCPSFLACWKFWIWLAPVPPPTRLHPTSRSQPDQNYPILRALHCLVRGRQGPRLWSVLYNSDTHVSFARAHHSHSKV